MSKPGRTVSERLSRHRVCYCCDARRLERGGKKNCGAAGYEAFVCDTCWRQIMSWLWGNIHARKVKLPKLLLRTPAN